MALSCSLDNEQFVLRYVNFSCLGGHPPSSGPVALSLVTIGKPPPVVIWKTGIKYTVWPSCRDHHRQQNTRGDGSPWPGWEACTSLHRQPHQDAEARRRRHQQVCRTWGQVICSCRKKTKGVLARSASTEKEPRRGRNRRTVAAPGLLPCAPPLVFEEERAA